MSKAEVRRQKPEAGKDAIQEKKPGIKSQNQISDARPQTSAPINKEHKKELQKQQKIFQQLEEKIAVLTKQRAELEAALTDPATYSDKQKFLQAESSYNKAALELEQLNKQYEQVFEKIVELEAKQN